MAYVLEEKRRLSPFLHHNNSSNIRFLKNNI